MNATRTSTTFFTAQLAALLIMIVGWGWIAGNFAQPSEPLLADAITDLAHAVPAILLFILGWRYFGAALDGKRRGGSYVGIGVIAVLALVLLGLGGIVLSLVGITNANPNSVGIHNLDDAIPAVLTLGGSALWLVFAFLARRQRAAAVSMR
ncbi:MAG TPA: hypothetical protein VMV29_00750 [Ktedonobacterales bacterium]|nr:hypothetical protein [Ktedonobacterales bacterium]